MEAANICNLSSGIYEKGIEQGQMKGIKAFISMCKEFGCDIAQTAKQITNKFELPPDEAMNCTKQFW